MDTPLCCSNVAFPCAHQSRLKERKHDVNLLVVFHTQVTNLGTGLVCVRLVFWILLQLQRFLFIVVF